LTAVRPAPVGRRERHKAAKLERIHEAARRLFGKKGFERTSIKEIAEVADVAVGTVFLYAKSKEDLLVMCFRDEVGEAIAEAFRTVPRAPLLDQVMHVFEVMISHNVANLELARVFTREIPFAVGARHGVKEVMDAFHHRMQELIERGQQAGEIAPDVSPAMLGHTLWAVYFHFLLRWLGSGRRSPESLQPTLRDMIAVPLAGFRLPTAKKSRERRRRTENRP
ncbi:MAG: TetR/AcrR family transcriptional regulator, partial [Candidatus Binatia bacterium]